MNNDLRFQRNNSHDKEELISRRSAMLLRGKTSFLLLLCSRLFYMQFIDRDKYQMLSDTNRIKTVILTPERGNIIDGLGSNLTENKVCYNLTVDKKFPKQVIDTEILNIQRFFHLTDKDIEYIHKNVKRASFKVPSTLPQPSLT
ncbi:MAG TPA: hypothetical protein QKA14_02195, partial [Candidatus Megaira endosymbiont of Hartmannula sinica]|nr:hypothetical protein [Candidatus Megaera endosymbiont of Hartmannula sinica]